MFLISRAKMIKIGIKIEATQRLKNTKEHYRKLKGFGLLVL